MTTATEKMVEKFTLGLRGPLFRRLFDILGVGGLHPLGKLDTATLLFQKRSAENKVEDIFAFRVGPPQVISFPRSFWLQRKARLSQLVNLFELSERPAVIGPVSDTQFSAGQVEISKTTVDRIEQICRQMCEELNAE